MSTNGREPISKSLRFEILKRDKFTCKYCGAKAPDVVLHVDHIHPVKEGGGNDPMNLVTACRACNAGKAARLLDQNAVVAAARAQVEANQDEINQLEMMASWHDEMAALDEKRVKFINGIMRRNFGFMVNGSLLNNLRKALEKYGAEKFAHAAKKSADWARSLPAGSQPGHTTICRSITTMMGYGKLDEDPKAAGAYIAAVLRNKFGADWGAMATTKRYVKDAMAIGVPFQELKDIACQADDLYSAWGGFEGAITVRDMDWQRDHAQSATTVSE
jgi:hypothetical protein